MEHLISAWGGIGKQVRSAEHVLLLSDYDGTLTPIMERPELAVLPPASRQLLQALARLRRFTLGIISGRALADLKDKVGITGIIYAGNHGLEIEGPGLSFVEPVADEIRPFLRTMHYILDRALSTIKGVFVENKGLSLSIHYRLAKEHESGEVERIVKEVVSPAETTGMARITSGKKVYEVRPAVDWDKGRAIRLLMRKYGHGGGRSRLMPIYIGDDLTDEDGFRVVRNWGGLSVLVGEETRESAAAYFLKSPAEVASFLAILLEENRKVSHWP